MFLRALRTIAKLLRAPLRGPGREFTIDQATLDDLASGEPVSFGVWLTETEEPTYCLELGRVAGLWTVTREKLSLEGLNFDSQAGPFEFGTETRGTIRRDTPGTPPRHATLPYLVFPYQRDSVALHTIRPLLHFRDVLGVAYSYRVNPIDLLTPTLPPWINRKKPYTDGTGTGFVHTLQAWYQTVEGEQAFKERVQPELKRLFPHIGRIGFAGISPRISLHYDTDRSRSAIPGHLESDGVNLSLFLLTIPFLLDYSERTALLIGVEEPEAGTHPYLQSTRLELLRRLARGDVLGRPVQMIATTHSLELLRWVSPEEALDVLRFVEHLGPGGGTQIHRVREQSDIDRIFHQYDGNIGTAWYSGVFGGVPSRPERDSEN